MIEIQNRVRETIPEEVMLARLEQSEQMREFFIEMWKQNPVLAKQGGERIRRLLSPMETLPPTVNVPAGASLLERQTDRQRTGSCISDESISTNQSGISLIELIMFIVIISVALTGILLVMNQVTRHSADPLIHKQALAIAESLLEEVELMPFTYCARMIRCRRCHFSGGVHWKCGWTERPGRSGRITPRLVSVEVLKCVMPRRSLIT